MSGRLRDQFTLRTDKITQAIEHRMVDYEAVLRGGVALFLASTEVSRKEFGDYFQHLEAKRYYPGLQGIGFAKLTRDRELGSLVQAVRSEGFSSFHVHPLGPRARYTPIVYIEPFDMRNQRAFGFDMYSEPSRRAAMDRAAQTRLPSASGIVQLVQETGEDLQNGFLMYLSVIHDRPVPPGRGPGGLVGFVYSPFRVADLMRGIMGEDPKDIDYALYDGDSAQSFFDTRDTAPARAPELARRLTLEVAGRMWTVRYWSRKDFGSWISRSQPLWVLLGGVVINLLLFYIIGSGASLQRRAYAMAQQMTNELTLSHSREQSQMLASLREKETLLKEIHHRVKNNLQVVSSLLSLQQSHTSDERAIEPLQQSQYRVRAMAALHEFLYQSSDLSRVDTKAYLSHLVKILAESYRASERVDLTLEIESVSLDLDQAIPCGLIVNELVTNAFKYAFPGDARGRLTVRLHADDGKVVLEVGDDGPGLPEAVTAELPSTLGLQLVQLLSDQLGGIVQITREHGTLFAIRFPHKHAQARS